MPTTLDGSGNITAWLLSVDYYSYDALNRLTRVDELPAASWVSNGAIGWLPQAYSQCYKYDRFGKRTLNTVGTWGNSVNRKNFSLGTPDNRLDKPGSSGCPSTWMCYFLRLFRSQKPDSRSRTPLACFAALAVSSARLA